MCLCCASQEERGKDREQIDFSIKKKKKKIYLCYFWPPWVFVAVRGLSLVVESRGYSPVAVPRLLIAVSPVVEHRL